MAILQRGTDFSATATIRQNQCRDRRLAGLIQVLGCTLTSSCRRHDMDPQRYLTQLLTNSAILAGERTADVVTGSMEAP